LEGKERCRMRKKITVITGGSSGLGLAAARCMCSESPVLLCARGMDKLEQVKKELETFGAEVYVYAMDAVDVESVRECAEYAVSLGDVKHVIHTAGVSPANHGTDDILRINTQGPVNMVQEFYPRLTEGGAMILFSSTAGYTFDTNDQMAPLLPLAKKLYENWKAPDFPQQMQEFIADVMKIPEPYQAGMAYCLSKNFVKHFVYANVWRFAQKGCRILSISPGSYLTPMHQALIDNQPETAAEVMEGIPLKRWGHAYEMGKLVQFLCSPGAGYITGVDILADGGCTYGAVTGQMK
jgi:NAD(P)-dependent dehydrogenase (short-subunit alcohol dehydrogenase family)